MDKVETIQEFYKSKHEWMPDNIRKEIGHFNVFRLEPYVGSGAKPAPYRRRDYFKVMLVNGNGKFHYADKVVDVQKHALVFSNPQIPYSWEERDQIDGGSFCIFNQHFFHQHGNLIQYAIFHPGGTPVFELSGENAGWVQSQYDRMFEEINSDFTHKYDVLRTCFRADLFCFKIAANSKSQWTKHKRIAANFCNVFRASRTSVLY